MTIPLTAIELAEVMDPADIQDYVLDLRSLLEAGEQFSTITVAVYPESAALGFQVRDADPYEPVELSDAEVQIWCSVDPTNQADATWQGAGQACGVEVTGVTDSSPPRQFQRSAVIMVAER